MAGSIIRVRRRKDYFGLAGVIPVYIDSTRQKIPLWFGETEDYPVAPGFHTIQIADWFWTSPDFRFEVKNGETVSFECGCKYGLWRLPFVLFGILFDRKRFFYLVQRASTGLAHPSSSSVGGSIVRVKRGRDFCGIGNVYAVYIDSTREKIPLWIGKTEDYLVVPGSHTIRVAMDWYWTSPELRFEVKQGEVVSLECGCKYGRWLLLLSLFGMIFDRKRFFFVRPPSEKRANSSAMDVAKS